MLLGIVGSLPAGNSVPYIGAPSRVVNTVDITFDTNLPKSGTPYAGQDRPSSGEITSPILTVDGIEVGYLTVQNSKGTFQGPIAFSWEVGSTHTYSWEQSALFDTGKRYVFNSVSGISSGQSGTITVVSEGTITANYKDEVLLSVVIRDSSGNECSCGNVSPQSGWYAVDSIAQIQASPFTGYTFQKSAITSTYVGVQSQQPITDVSTQNPTAITFDTAKTVTVYFQQSQITPTQPTPTTTPTPTPSAQKQATQTTKYLLYENKQYSFSIKYPSDWKKTVLLQDDTVFPGLLNMISLGSPAGDAGATVGFMQDDTSKGISQKVLNSFKNEFKSKFESGFCSSASAGVTCSVDVLEDQVTSKKGYDVHVMALLAKMSSTQTSFTLPAMLVGIIPNGNDAWIVMLSNLSVTDTEQVSKVLDAIAESFTILDYSGGKSSTSKSPASTFTKSSAGELQINSGEFAVSKYSPAEVLVSGKVANYQKGTMLTLKIIKPDKRIEEQNIMVTKDGVFRTPIKLDNNWRSGDYAISATYGTQDLGSVSFQVNVGNTKPSVTQTTPLQQKQPPVEDVKPSATKVVTQKQFHLGIKAGQKDDLVYLVIKNPKGSSDDIYGIKLTAVNGKITNFIKITDWIQKRLGPDSVIYQTVSSPLHSSDMIQVKLKVDSKNTEIQWEVFTKDQKSLGKGSETT